MGKEEVINHLNRGRFNLETLLNIKEYMGIDTKEYILNLKEKNKTPKKNHNKKLKLNKNQKKKYLKNINLKHKEILL